MNFLLFLWPSILDFLVSPPATSNGMVRMLQGINDTVPLPTVPPVTLPPLPGASVPTFNPEEVSNTLPPNWQDDLLPFNSTRAGKIQKEREMKMSEKAHAMIIRSVVGSLVHILILCIGAACYKSKVTDRRHSFPDSVSPEYSMKKDTFPFGLCSCFEDCTTCCFGWFCQPCRVGDTMTQVGASSYWKMVTAWMLGVPLAIMLQNVLLADVLLKAMNQLAGMMNEDMNEMEGMSQDDGPMQQYSLRLWLGTWLPRILFIALCLLLAAERQKLRKNLGARGKNKFAFDFCCYCWCFCCAIIQDARTVDGAADTAVHCPCRLVRLSKTDVLGEPVSVSEDSSNYSASDSD